jgi:hypothetical protein
MNPRWQNELSAAVLKLRMLHGEKFSTYSLASKFLKFFNGPRIEVRTTYDDGSTYVRRGRVSITTGWAPVFILVHRRNARSSSDILKETDEIVRVVSP